MVGGTGLNFHFDYLNPSLRFGQDFEFEVETRF